MNRRDFLLIGLTSARLILSFPPFPTGCIAFFALVPFLFFLEGKTVWESIRGGYVIGVLWAAGTLYWIGWATVIGLVGSLIWMGLPMAIFAALQAWFLRRWDVRGVIAAPILWTGVEILFSQGAMGFTWNSLAYSQTYQPAFIQTASVTGMFGVTVWVMALNVLAYFIVRVWKHRYSVIRLGTVVLLILILPYVYGHLVMPPEELPEEGLNIALIQGNIDPYKKWSPSFIDSNFVVYDRLTAQAAEFDPDLVVWPETASPSYLRYRFGRLRQIKARIDSLGVPLLTGAPDFTRRKGEKPSIYNSAMFIRTDSWRLDSYRKMKLVPFGERVPLVGDLPILYDLAKRTHLDVGGFSPGDTVMVFQQPYGEYATIPFSTIICYESIFPYLVRKFVRAGARFLVIITNDGWFGKTSGPVQHAQIAVYRAIENRTWVARCANTGISEFIDPYGRIRSKTRFNEETVLPGRIGIDGGRSLFVNYGYVFMMLISVLNVLLIGSTVFQTIYRGKKHDSIRVAV